MAAILFCLLGTHLHAQYENGSLVGTIHDATGAAVSGAAVTVTNNATAITAKTTTNASGDYEFPSLRVGVYTISASAPGFSDAVAKNITVSVGGRQRIDLTLQVGSTTTTVEVSDVALQVETETSQRGQTITDYQTAAFPSSAATTPTSSASSPASARRPPPPPPAPSTPSSAPAPTTSTASAACSTTSCSTAWTTTPTARATRASTTRSSPSRPTPSPSSRSSPTTRAPSTAAPPAPPSTSPPPAEPTNSTPPSTSSSATPTSTPPASSSPPPSATPATSSPSRSPPSTATSSASTSAAPSSRTSSSSSSTTKASARSSSRSASSPSPPRTNSTATSSSRSRIPSPARSTPPAPPSPPPPSTPSPHRSSASSRQIPGLPQSGLASTGLATNDYAIQVPFTDNSDKGDLRLDYQQNPNSSWFLRVSDRKENGVNSPALPLPLDGQTNGTIRVLDQQVALGYTHLFGANKVLDARLGLSRTKAGKYSLSIGNNAFTIPGLPTDPTVAGGLPSTGITGFTGFGRQSTNPQWQNPALLDPKVNFTWVKGKHSLKFGYEYEHIWMAVNDNNPLYGSFTYGGGYSANGATPVSDNYWADFLFGTTNTYSLANFFVAHLRQTLHSAYAQDDWKVSPTSPSTSACAGSTARPTPSSTTTSPTSIPSPRPS